MASDVPKYGEYLEGRLWFQRKVAIVTLGLTNLAIEEIGTVDAVELPDEEQDFTKGEVVVTVMGSNGKIEVTAPGAGFISEVNEALREEPDRVSEDPTEEGWLVKMQLEDTSELKDFE